MVQPIEYIPRQHRLGLGAQAMSKEQLKQMMEGKSDKRMMAVTENYQASSVGRNYKTIDEKLQIVKKLGVGSRVEIISGTHKGLEGKIVAVSKQSGKDSYGMGQDQDGSLINPETYVSIELRQNNTVVQVKRKRIQMKPHKPS